MRAATLLSLPVLLALPAAAQPAPGTCAPGTAEAVLDGSDVTARLFNGGNLFFGNTSQAEYVVEGTSAIFSASVWFGGIVDGEIRTAGATYSRYEFWPGPLGDDGRPVDPADCSGYDRIWSVYAADVDAYEAGSPATADLAEWPADLGAPVLDGDGIAGNYDLAAGDRPDLGGGAQAAFWVMNDVGNQHESTESEPLGIEVRVLAVAPEIGDERIDEATVYRYEIMNKGAQTIDEMRAAFFNDADLGDYIDDFVGTDTAREMVYVYNENNVDGGSGYSNIYGYAPPALGAVLLTDELFGSLGIISGNSDLADPSTRTEYYNVMSGLLANGNSLTFGGNGTNPANPPTRFAYPGDPLSGEGWSEVSAGNIGDDRRFTASVAPWSLAPGESKTMTIAIAYGRSENHLLSVAALRNAADAVRAWHDGEPLPPPFTLDVLAAPALTGPDDATIFVDEPALLSWTEVPGAAGCTVDVSTSPDFLDPALSFTVDSTSLPYADYNFQGELLCYGAICDRGVYWRVRAYGADPAAISPPSETRQFAVVIRGDDAFAANGLGITETQSADGQDPCRVSDAACWIGLGNGVFGHPDAAEDYLVGADARDEISFYDPDRIGGNAIGGRAVTYPDDYEVRFTAACADDATPCYGLYSTGLGGGVAEPRVVRVPFEAYNVGGPLPESTTEEVRLIPVLRPGRQDANGENVYAADWADTFPTTRGVEGVGPLGPVAGMPDSLAVTEALFLFMPTEPGGYARFAADAAASGGAGAVLNDSYPGDPECSRNQAYADFCFRSETAGGSRNYVIGGLLFADYAGDGTTPGVGTTVRFWGDNAAPPALPSEDEPAGALAFGLGAPYPNPAADRLTVPYVLAADGAVRISVVDVLGRTVALAREGLGSASRSEVEVATDRLAPGLYLVVLEAEGQRAVRRVTIAR